MVKIDSPIKVLREEIGVSQRQLADALEVHHSLIANLENNLINIKEDEEIKSKTIEVFEKLAKWSGKNMDELIKKQIESTSESFENVKEQVKKQIGEVAEIMGGSTCLSGDEVEIFCFELEIECKNKCKSPIAVIREKGGITQRHMAQASGVSQAYIARIERGELAIFGPNTGWQLNEFIMESLTNEEYAYLIDSFNECQRIFIKLNKEQSKDKVKKALEKIKRKKK